VLRVQQGIRLVTVSIASVQLASPRISFQSTVKRPSFWEPQWLCDGGIPTTVFSIRILTPLPSLQTESAWRRVLGEWIRSLSGQDQAKSHGRAVHPAVPLSDHGSFSPDREGTVFSRQQKSLCAARCRPTCGGTSCCAVKQTVRAGTVLRPCAAGSGRTRK